MSSQPLDTPGMRTDAPPLLSPHILDAAPLGPLFEPWPARSTWVCAYRTDRWRLLVGPRQRWTLVREGVGRVALGEVGEA